MKWFSKRSHHGFTLIEIMIVVLIMGILLNLLVMNTWRALIRTRYTRCIGNLKQIQSAKEQWAMENNRSNAAIPNDDDLFGADRYVKVKPECPVRGTYQLRAVSEPPTCTIGGVWPHRIP
ncbi:MAG: hypothetical protein OHK0029_30880 [Armatimonadaceae bacterium]